MTIKTLLKFLITFESGRGVKVNENGEVSHHATWKVGCQGVLVDSKTVVTTADCAGSMPDTGSYQVIKNGY